MALTHAEVCRRLEREIELQGSLRRAAISLRISPQYLSQLLSGQRAFGKKILKTLRLKRQRVITDTYTEVRRAQS